MMRMMLIIFEACWSEMGVRHAEVAKATDQKGDIAARLSPAHHLSLFLSFFPSHQAGPY
jgi:hypothetical protein